MDRCAPIALFAYNRPEHVAATLSALAANELAAESDLTIFCDGPASAEHVEKTQRVREIARSATGFRSVRVVEREENYGLARSVITGIGEVLERHETIIVMEDDLVTSPFFLRFVNDGLRTYAGDDRVISICGYTFPVRGSLPETFFLPGAFCWGWGTWRRRWALFEHDARRALDEIVRRDLVYEFDFQGSDPLTHLLQMTVLEDSRADSWATRWMATACLNGTLTLYPGRSLVQNIGFDGSGRHGPQVDRFRTLMAEALPRVGSSPVELSPEVVASLRELFASWRVGRNWKKRIFYRFRELLPRSLDKRLYTYRTRQLLAARERTARVAAEGRRLLDRSMEAAANTE